MYDGNNFEVNTLTKWMKAERNREDWEKYKAAAASKRNPRLSVFNCVKVIHGLPWPLCRPCHDLYISTNVIVEVYIYKLK